MRFAVFWRISVRFCGFRTPLTPPLVAGQPIQKTVAIINTRCNKCMDKHFRRFSRQMLADAFDIMQIVKGNTA